jgi:hypothetical protein
LLLCGIQNEFAVLHNPARGKAHHQSKHIKALRFIITYCLYQGKGFNNHSNYKEIKALREATRSILFTITMTMVLLDIIDNILNDGKFRKLIT